MGKKHDVGHHRGYYRGGKYNHAGTVRTFRSLPEDAEKTGEDAELDRLAPERGDDFSDVRRACDGWLREKLPKYDEMRSFRYGCRAEG